MHTREHPHHLCHTPRSPGHRRAAVNAVDGERKEGMGCMHHLSLPQLRQPSVYCCVAAFLVLRLLHPFSLSLSFAFWLLRLPPLFADLPFAFLMYLNLLCAYHLSLSLACSLARLPARCVCFARSLSLASPSGLETHTH